MQGCYDAELVHERHDENEELITGYVEVVLQSIVVYVEWCLLLKFYLRSFVCKLYSFQVRGYILPEI